MSRRMWVCVGGVLGAGGEIGQAVGIVPGTFDLMDLVLCVMAAVVAALVTPLLLRMRHTCE